MRRSTPSLVLYVLLAVFLPAVLLAQPAFLVKDINPSTDHPPSQFLSDFAQANGLLFFLTDDGIHGMELWRSDGSEAGTFLLTDACPGICDGSDPSIRFAASDSTLYFSRGLELWKSDGSPAGTVPLPLGLDIADMAVVNGKLLLSASLPFNQGTGYEPWESDGTAAGTVQLADIFPGSTGSGPLFLGKAGANLFFAATDPTHGQELWVTDGTAAGTVFVKDLNGTSAGSSFDSPHAFQHNGSFATVGNRFFFRTQGGQELWVTDGTGAGTVRINDLVPGNGWTGVKGLTARSGDIVFEATAGGQNELWKTDGTAAGTVELKSSGVYIPLTGVIDLAAAGETVYFVGTDGTDPRLWKTDGTPAGTVRVGDGSEGTLVSGANFLAPVGSELLFYAQDAAHGLEPWKTDGSAAGTSLLADINPGPSSSFRSIYLDRGSVMDGGSWFFGATDGTTFGLWMSDGTAAGTQLVRRLPAQSSSIDINVVSFPTGAIPGSLLYFGALDSGFSTDLWKSDGTAAGTKRVQTSGAPHAYLPSQFAFLGGGVAVFTANASPRGTFWRTDGTDGGTRQLTPAVQSASSMCRIGNKEFLAGTQGGVTSLWTTDGTTTLNVVSAGGHPVGGLSPLGNLAVYTANGSLYVSDGTDAGTRLVTGSYSPADSVTPVGDRFFFAGFSSDAGTQLWVGDAATASAQRAAVIPGDFSSVEREPAAVLSGRLVFKARNDATGSELWASDGTQAGTVQLADIHPGPASSDIANLSAGRDKVWFTADDGTHGRELWVTDGTPAGTHMVRDIMPGAGSSYPQQLQVVGHILLFSALDAAHGLELWRSDGTEAGTYMLQDIAPGPAPSSPRWFTVTDSYVFFIANDNVTGFEPWAIPRAALGSKLTATKTVSGQSFEGGTVTYTIVIENAGAGPSTDNPGDEMSDVLPAGLTLLDASARIGTATADLPNNRVSWNGALSVDGTVTVTIHARINSGAFPGVLLNQATLAYDADGNGTNESAGVSDGPSAGAPTPLPLSLAAADLFTMTPCRIVDTRSSSALASGVARSIPVAGTCGIPAGAKAVAANVTVVSPTGPGYVSVYPNGAAAGTATVTFAAGQVLAGNAMLALKNGAVDAKALVGGNGTVQLVIDVSGYFQ